VQDDNVCFVVGLDPQSFGDPATTCQGQADFNSCVAIVAAFVKETGQLDRVRSTEQLSTGSSIAFGPDRRGEARKRPRG
jgi:hypothetical protein